MKLGRDVLANYTVLNRIIILGKHAGPVKQNETTVDWQLIASFITNKFWYGYGEGPQEAKGLINKINK